MYVIDVYSLVCQVNVVTLSTTFRILYRMTLLLSPNTYSGVHVVSLIL